jgi:hypothetical protein
MGGGGAGIYKLDDEDARGRRKEGSRKASLSLEGSRAVVDLVVRVGVGHLDNVFSLGGAKLWLLLPRFSLLLLRSRAPLIPLSRPNLDGGNWKRAGCRTVRCRGLGTQRKADYILIQFHFKEPMISCIA